MSKTANKPSVERLFGKYVFQNICGMLGISAYILADTFFISLAEGANGLTALNLVLPLYSIIFGIGSMIGVGSATKFKIHRARGDKEADNYFSNAILFCFIFGLFFVVLGLLAADKLVSFLGADAVISALASPYTKIFMVFSPFFMWNYVFNAFVRNDGAPALAMTATICSSLFNIIMDYVLMFPFGLGMVGAALATAFSPIVGILICCIHFLKKENTICFLRIKPSFRRLVTSCQLGAAAFVGEISSGVITVVFNFIILNLVGNDGVAAFGVVANTAIVATAIFNGISQGSQPLFSEYYGKKDHASIRKTLFLSIGTALVLAGLILLCIWIWAPQLVAIFNSEQNAVLASYAIPGIRLYFIGFLFAGFNIVCTGYLGATEAALSASVTSLLRGFVAIIFFAFLLSYFFGMTGVWIAFPVAELVTALVATYAVTIQIKKQK